MKIKTVLISFCRQWTDCRLWQTGSLAASRQGSLLYCLDVVCVALLKSTRFHTEQQIGTRLSD